MKRHALVVGLATMVVLAASAWTDAFSAEKASGPIATLRLTNSPENPRNSEGDFIQLKDGRILFVYTHFTGGDGDHAPAHLAGRYSSDGGKTWTDRDVMMVPNTSGVFVISATSDGGKTWTDRDVRVVPNASGMNVMSVSLLRLANGEIALFYLAKNSEVDCRPVMRISTDEAKTWSEPITIIPDQQTAYYILNNDRVVQLAGGRLVAPVVTHATAAEPKFHEGGIFMCYLSDDNGRTWRRGRGMKNETRTLVLQEPGVVELKDGRLMAFCRTTHGSQHLSYSSDGGETWTEFIPSSIISPCSPASIERIPSTGDLLLVWNNHDKIEPALEGTRTPFNTAISKDDGKTWQNVKTIADERSGWYCYTAVDFVDDCVLLGHCAGDTRENNGLAVSQVTRVPIQWLYETK